MAKNPKTIASFRSGHVLATLTAAEYGRTSVHKVRITSSYFDGGERKATSQFDPEDLNDLAKLARKSARAIDSDKRKRRQKAAASPIDRAHKRKP